MPDNNKKINLGKISEYEVVKNTGNSALTDLPSGPVNNGIGNTDFGNSKSYDNVDNTQIEDIQSGDYQYMRGEQQSGLAQLGLGVLRAGAKAGVEFAKTPAYLYALGEWSLDNIKEGGNGITLDKALDNVVLNSLESLDENIKNQIPVYQSYKSGKGGILDALGSTAFWASDGADGVGYLLGMWGGSAILKAANLASKLTKLGVGANTAGNIELGSMTLLNSSTEALGEAKGVVDRIKSNFNDLLDPNSSSYNPINPETGEQWTKKEMDEAVAKAGKETFYSNIALLLVPDFIMNKNLLGRFNVDKSILDEFKDVNGKLMSNPVIKKTAIKDYTTKALGSAIPEIFEEGSQTSIENYELNKALNKVDDNFVKGVAEEFLNTLTTTEGHKAMVLGGLLGSIGGVIGKRREDKANKKFLNKYGNDISKLIEDNFDGFASDLEIYDRDENGVQTNINPVKLKEAAEDFIKEVTESKLKDVATLNEDKILADHLDNKSLTRLSIPFFKLNDVGLELLNDKIDNASKTLTDTQQVDQVDENKFKTERKAKIKQLYDIYQNTKQIFSELDAVKVLYSTEGSEEYIEKMINAAYQENAKQVFYKEKIKDLDLELSKFNSTIFNDLPQNQLQVDKLKKQISGLYNILEDSKNKFKSLLSPEKQIEALEEFVNTKKEQAKNVEDDIKSFENEKITKEKSEGIKNEINSDLEQALNSNSFEEFENLRNKIENNSYSDLDTRNKLKAKEGELNKIIDVFANAIINNTVPNDLESQQFYSNNITKINDRVREIHEEKSKIKEPKSFSEIINQNTNNDSELISENNQLILDNPDNQNHPITDNQSDSKNIKYKVNVVMMRLFKHFYKNNLFKFERNNGFIILDNSSNINIKAVNNIKKGDKVNLKLVDLPSEVTELYKDLEDYDGKHIGIYNLNDELLGFVRQPHPISNESGDPSLSIKLRQDLINYRKNVIKSLTEGITVQEEVSDKGTGNLYTLLDNNGNIKPDFKVFETARPQDKIEDQLVFVYSNSEGKIKLPNNTDLDEDTLKQINIRLAQLNKYSSKKGKVFQLVKDLAGNLTPMPVYANTIDSITLKSIDSILKGFSNDFEPKDIISALQPYIYVTEYKRGVPVTIKKEGGIIKIWNQEGMITLDDYQSNKAKRNSFLNGLKGVRQNIDINSINNPEFQKEMFERQTLITNVTTFNGEYFVQPYIEFTQNNVVTGIPTTTKSEEQELVATQPSNNIEAKKTDIERRRQEELEKYRSDALALENAKTEEEAVEAIKQTTKEENKWKALSAAENIMGKSGFNALFQQDWKKQTKLLADEISKIQKNFIDKINAKYDAELAALEQAKNDTLNDKVKDILNTLDLDTPLDNDNALSKSKDSTILNRTKFIKWLNKNLPQIKLSDINNIYALKDVIVDAFGLFRDSTIYLFEGAGMKTAYHEAFHGVFRNLLTVEQREALINEAKKKYNAPTEEDLESLQEGLKNKYTKEQLTYLYYEEQLANDFAVYTNNLQNQSFLSNFGRKIKDFFNKILEYFKLFKSSDTSFIDNTFDSINKGKFANLTSNSKSVVNIPIFNEYAYSKTLNTKLGVSSKIKIVNSIANKFLHDFQQNLNNNIPTDTFKIINDIHNHYKELLVSNTLSTKDKLQCGKIIVNMPEIWEEVKKNLSARNIKSKLVLGYNKIKEEVDIQEEGVLEFNTNLTKDEEVDYEIITLESKTDKGLGEWTSISGLSSASTRLKLFLSSIPVLNKNNEVVKDNLGVEQYHDFNELYYYIERNLIDKYEFNEQLDVLTQLSQIRPVLKQVVEKLTVKSNAITEDNFNLLVNDFKTNFSKQQLGYTLVKFFTNRATNKTSYKIIDANRATLSKELFEQFSNNISNPSRNSIGTYDNEGNKVINVDKATELFNNWQDIKDKPLEYNSILNILNKAGIEYTDSVLNSIVSSNDIMFKNNLNTVLKWYSSGMSPDLEAEARKSLYSLVEYEVQGVLNKYTSSFINGEKKNIYTIQLPSYISKTVNKLKNKNKFKSYKAELQKDIFYKHNNLLQELERKEVRDNFKISYLDSFKDDRGNSDGVSFISMNTKDFLSMQVALFQNKGVNNQKITGLKTSKYIYLTPSDKTMCVLIDYLKYDTVVDDKNDIDPSKSKILDKYYNIVVSEALRISKANAIKKDIIDNQGDGIYNINELLQYYHFSKSSFEKLSKMIESQEYDWDVVKDLFDGASFKFNYFSKSFNDDLLDKFNDSLNKSSDELFYELNKYDNREYIINLLQKEINQDYKKILKEFENKGLITRLENGLYKNLFLDLNEEVNIVEGEQITNLKSEETEDRQIKHLIANFSANTLLNNIEFNNMFNGDFAQYKPGDLQKRTYQSQAMTTFGNFVNKVIKTVVVKDVYSASSMLNDINTALKSQGFTDEQILEISGAYNKINVTDAQVYITPEFYKRIHVARGTWNNEMQEAYDIAEGIKTGNIKESLHRLLGGIKPYYFGNRFDKNLNIHRFEQVKCAMLPLFKSYTDSNPLLKDKREEMILAKIDMLAHESSFKAAIGFRNTIEDNYNYINLDLSTDNFGVQVDNPDHITEGNDSLRQLKMLMLGSIDPNKMYNGKSGQDIINNILKLESLNIKKSLNKIKDKMDIKTNINFTTFIKDMVTKRGASINVEETLNILNGDFEYALDNGNLSSQIENLISSLITNNVIKQKFDVGGSAVQATSLGFKYKNLAEQQANLTNDAKLLQQELKWIKPNVENGTLGYIECAMPATSSHFFNKDGTLKDINNIPEELRTFLAYRIPTEGLHSMMPIKVVKFLPETMGNFILLPEEVTTQFGADFDFDKVYFFGNEFFTNESNELEKYEYVEGTDKKSVAKRYYYYAQYHGRKNTPTFEDFQDWSIEEQLIKPSINNNIVSEYLNLLTSINNLHLIIAPSGFTQIENFKEEHFIDRNVNNFFSSKTQRDYKERNHIGIALKGQAALHVTGHSYGKLMNLSSYTNDEEGKLDLNYTININGLNRYNFSNMYTDNGKLITDELASIMAAILDDIKNPLLEPLGINNNTIDILATIIRAGYNMKTALAFTSQPAVKHLSVLLQGNKNKLKNSNEGQITVNNLIATYTDLAIKAFDELNSDNPAYEDYINIIKRNDKSSLNIEESDMLKMIDTYKIDKGELQKGHIVEGKTNLKFKKATPEESLIYYSYQTRVLKQFKTVSDISKDLVKINKFFSINKEVGPNIEDIISKKDLLDNISTGIISGFDITKIPTLESTWKAHEYALNWFSDYFPYSTNTYMNIKNSLISSQSSKKLNETTVEQRQYINNFIRTYTDYDVFNNVPNKKDKLLNDLPILINKIKNNINKSEKIGSNTYEEIKNNLFIQNIKVVFDPINKVSYLRLKANRLDLQVKNNIIQSFSALYNNENTKSLAKDIIEHSFLTTGFFKGINSFSNLISPEILKELGYNDFRKEIIWKLKNKPLYLNYEDTNRLIDQLVRNNRLEFTKTFDGLMFEEFSNISLDGKQIKPLPKKLTTNPKLIKASNREDNMIWYVFDEDGEKIIKTPKYISVYDVIDKKSKLYKNTEMFKYEQINELGQNGTLLEINPFSDIEKSVLKNTSSSDENIEGVNKPSVEENLPNEDSEKSNNNLNNTGNQSNLPDNVKPCQWTVD